MGDRIINKLPYHFVDYLRNPGLETMAGRVPLRKYMSLKKGNKEINSLLFGLRAKKIKDNVSGLGIDETVGATELDLIWKGQGYPPAFIKLMNFLCENQEKMRDAGGDLTKIYDSYFRDNNDVNALTKMVDAKYFGIECIGFVSNFLRYVGLWDRYLPYEIDQWTRVFTSKVMDIASVSSLNLLIWPGSHVALIDTVHKISGNVADIDLCQSANDGPQCHEHITLQQVGTSGGAPMFSVIGGKPAHTVKGNAYAMSWPDLHYQQPQRLRGPSPGGNAASTVELRK